MTQWIGELSSNKPPVDEDADLLQASLVLENQLSQRRCPRPAAVAEALPATAGVSPAQPPEWALRFGRSQCPAQAVWSAMPAAVQQELQTLPLPLQRTLLEATVLVPSFWPDPVGQMLVAITAARVIVQPPAGTAGCPPEKKGVGKTLFLKCVVATFVLHMHCYLGGFFG